MFYEYRQNNSGGHWSFDFDKGISVLVIIEAPDAEYADFLAKRIGLYFDGCYTGSDCGCCGDRWHTTYGDGDETPTYYGSPLGAEVERQDKPAVFVHYRDRTVQGYRAGDKYLDSIPRDRS